jgi:multisubunit Na+/H+ antiporter MnhB subunit
MRANRLKFLAPFLLIASLAVALGALFAPGVAHAGGSLAICPAGTNWDHLTGTCH